MLSLAMGQAYVFTIGACACMWQMVLMNSMYDHCRLMLGPAIAIDEIHVGLVAAESLMEVFNRLHYYYGF